MEDIGFNSEVTQGFTPTQEEERKPLTEEQAEELSTKLAIADQNLTPQEQSMIKEQLVMEGRSPIADDSVKAMVGEEQQNRFEQAAVMAAEEGGDLALMALSGRMNPDPVETLNNRINETAVASVSGDLSTDEILSILDNEAAIDAAAAEEYREAGVYRDSVWGDVAEFFTSMIPLRQGFAAVGVREMIEEKYGLEEGSAIEGLLFTGEYLEDVREFLQGLDSHTQLQAIRDIKDAAYKESWGNDFLRLGVLDQLLQDYDAGYNPEDLDIARGLNNAIAVLDATVVGKFAKNLVKGGKASRTAIAGSSEGSLAAKVNRIGGEEGARIHAAAIEDASGKSASQLGTTREDMIFDDLLPKYEEAGYASKVGEDKFNEMRELQRQVMARRVDQATNLSDEEKLFQANKKAERLKNVQGVNFRGNASSVQALEDTIVVNARYAKTATRGAKNEAERAEMLATLKRMFPGAEISEEVITHAGKIKKVTAKESVRSDQELMDALKAELRIEAEGAVKRADTTKGKALRGKAKGAAYDVKKANQMLRYLKGEKGARNVPRAVKEEADALVSAHQSEGTKRLRGTSVKAVIKDIQAQKLAAEKAGAEAVATEKAAKAGQVAKSELSRLEQGLEPKTPEWRKRLKQMRKDNVRTITREEAASDPTNEYFFNVQFKSKYDTTASALNLDEIYVGGKFAHYIADISSVFSKRLAQAVLRGFDQAQGVEKLMSRALEPFTKAGHDSKKFILQMAKRGDKDGEVYTVQRLIDQMPSNFTAKQKDEAIEGYLAFRHVSDMVYHIKNQKLRDVLQSEGFVHLNAGGIDMLAKPMAGGTRPAQVFDPVTNTMRAIDEVEAEGLQIYKTKNRFNTGENNYANHVVVRTDDVVSELPGQVLKYREGYVPRIYDEQYFVTIKNPNAYVNGVKVSAADVKAGKAPTVETYAAKSAKEAKALVARLEAENPGMSVSYRNSRELTMGESVSAHFNVERSTGGLFYSKRGEHVKDAADELASVENPVDAMQRMITSSARDLTLDATMELMRKRWVATFGHITQGQYPTSVELITNPNLLRDPEVAKARSMWQMLENAQNGSVTTREWRANMVRLGEWVEDKGLDKLGKAIRTGERDPFSVIRGTTHLLTIVANPLRQIFIQAQGALLNAGVDGFGEAMKNVQKAPLLLFATAVGKSKRDVAQSLIKRFGLDQDEELMAMIKGLDESGLVQAIDSHLLTRDALKNIDDEITSSLAGRGMQAVSNVATGTVGAIRRYGFDMGEQINIVSTYMIAFHRKKVQSGVKGVFKPTAQDLADIAGDARQMALTMNTPGAMGYQRGLFSITTQFLAVQHKAILAAAGGLKGVPILGGLSKYGNKVYTTKEARKIMLGQTLLYGASGWGLHNLVDSMLGSEELKDANISPEAREALIGGLYDYTANKIIEGLTGEDTDLSFSENIAAGGGFSRAITALFLDPLTAERPLPEVLLGPTLNTYSKLGELMKTSKLIFGTVLDGQELSKVQMDNLLNNAGRLFSGYNNWFKGRVVAKHNTWVDRNAQVIDPSLLATNTEATFYKFLGITDHTLSEYYKQGRALQDVTQGYKDTAKDFVDNVERTMAMYDQVSTEYGYMPEMIAALELENAFLGIGIEPHEKETLMKYVAQEIKRRGTEKTMAERLWRAAMSGTHGPKLRDHVRSMYRSKLIDAETATQLEEFFDAEEMIRSN